MIMSDLRNVSPPGEYPRAARFAGKVGRGAVMAIKLDAWSDFVDEKRYGQLVREQRQTREMTLEDLAQIARTSRATLQRVDLGTRYAAPRLKRRLEVALRPRPRLKRKPVVKEKPGQAAYTRHQGAATGVGWIDEEG